MQREQIIQGIRDKLDQSRIVFWYDPEQSYLDEVMQIDIEGVTVINLADESLLQTKKRLELDAPRQRFLLYFPYAEPEPEIDWLLDIRLYSEQFFADRPSMILNELGISRMSLRTHIQNRKQFFASQQRITALKKWVTEGEDELSFDRKMMAVAVKSDSASLSDILLSLLREYAEALQGLSRDVDDLKAGDALNLPLMDQLGKYELTDALWSYLKQEYSYDVEKPSLSDFALKIFCTELWTQIDATDRDWLLSNVLKSASGRATALAFMVNWRNHRGFSPCYEIIAKQLSQLLEVNRKTSHYLPQQLLECQTFEDVEQNIIRGLVSLLLDQSKRLDREQFNVVVSKRMSSHWCDISTKNGSIYASIYIALRQAELLIFLRQSYVDGFHYSSAKEMYDAYTNELYKFDQAYRLFNEHADQVQSKGLDILRKLDESVEKLYTNWYLYELGLAWDRHLSEENLMTNWKIKDIPSQYEFFQREVAGRLASKQAKRVFVVISDALRYEVAHELTGIINAEKRFHAELKSQLGVLPSYTQLGMASLLPHGQLAYQIGKEGLVFVDGMSTQGVEPRDKVLRQVKGIAVTAKEMMTWSNQVGRDYVRDAEVVYIYHDTIDAIGDKLVTEDKTLEACRTAIDELKDLVARIINRLNANRVLVTADHGFLFQQSFLKPADKTKLHSMPDNTAEAKKRYLIGESLPTDDAYWKGRISDTAGGQGDTEFLAPKGIQRFHFIGGARFVHGGAMPQEICVPVLHVRELEKDQVVKYEKQPVGVVAFTQVIKFVNNIDKIRFIQTDPIGESFRARQLDIYVIDQHGTVVSSRETINFDSSSKVMDDRTREVRIKLSGSNFNRNEAYLLVLENSETHTRYNQYSVTIDLAIQDDFF